MLNPNRPKTLVQMELSLHQEALQALRHPQILRQRHPQAIRYIRSMAKSRSSRKKETKILKKETMMKHQQPISKLDYLIVKPFIHIY